MDLPGGGRELVNAASAQSVIECVSLAGKTVARGFSILLSSTRFQFFSDTFWPDA